MNDNGFDIPQITSSNRQFDQCRVTSAEKLDEEEEEEKKWWSL